MNILVMSLKGPTIAEGGGAGEVIRQIGKRWIKNGHNVRILCSNDEGLDSRDIINGMEVFRKGTVYTAIFHFIISYYREHKEWADIIVENETSFPLFIPIYAYNVRKLVLVHGIKGKIYFQSQPFLKAIIGYVLEKAMPVFYRSTEFVAICTSTKNDLVDLGIPVNNIHVIENGVDAGKFTPNIKFTKPIISYIGRLEERKCVGDLIEAFLGFICKKFPDSELWIAGFGDKKDEIRLISENHDNIIFYGFVSEEKKIEIFQKSWIFVLPSILEGFPLTILESNSCGTPVVGYRALNGPIKDRVNGLIVDERSPRKLAEACMYLLENEGVRSELEKSSREYASNFSWENQSLKVLEIVLRKQ